MKRLLTLIHKEWRDQRPILGVAFVLSAAAFFCLELLMQENSTASLRSEWLHPLALAAISALITAEAFASDYQRGIERTISALPVPPVLSWVAKLTFAIIAIASFEALLIAAEWTTRTFEEPLVAKIPLAAGAAWWLVICAQTALVAALAVLLRRPLAAVLGGILIVVGIGRMISLLPPDNFGLNVELALSRWSPATLASTVIVLAFTASILPYVLRLRGEATLRRSLLSTGLLLTLFLPIGLPAATQPLRFRSFEPEDSQVFVHGVWPSPDQRYLAVLLTRHIHPIRWVPSLRNQGGSDLVCQTRIYDLELKSWKPQRNCGYFPMTHGLAGRELGPWDSQQRLTLWNREHYQIYDPSSESISWKQKGDASYHANWMNELVPEPRFEIASSDSGPTQTKELQALRFTEGTQQVIELSPGHWVGYTRNEIARLDSEFKVIEILHLRVEQ